jgi:hypothetical protein
LKESVVLGKFGTDSWVEGYGRQNQRTGRINQ